MDFLGFVDDPAHRKAHATFAQAPKKVELKHFFNEEKRIVTGVAIATDLLIYRRDGDFEYDVYFTKADTLTIMKMFAKNKYHNNVNLMHDQSRKVSDAYMIECYFINDEKSNIPEYFKNQNLQPGSLIFSYWVEGDDTWKWVKENGGGFSIEGWFNEVPVKFKNTKQNKMQKQSLFQRLFGAKPEKKVFDSAKKDKYATAQTSEGNTVYWDGALEVGNSLFVVPAEGEEPVLAPSGPHDIDVDGMVMTVTVDDNGVITEVIEKEAESNEELDATIEAMASEYRKMNAETQTKMQAMAKTIDDQNELIEKLMEKTGLQRVPGAGDNTPAWRKYKDQGKK